MTSTETELQQTSVFGSKARWVGLDNYAELFARPDLGSAMANTLLYTVVLPRPPATARRTAAAMLLRQRVVHGGGHLGRCLGDGRLAGEGRVEDLGLLVGPRRGVLRLSPLCLSKGPGGERDVVRRRG